MNVMRAHATTRAALGVALVVYAAAATWQAMWLWGVNVGRFLPIGLSLLLWTAPALLVAGVLAAPLGRAADWLWGRLEKSVRWRVGAALLLASVVWLLNDNTWFTGDFLVRRNAGTSSILFSKFQQSLPLEKLLFEQLPQAISGGPWEEGVVGRWAGFAAAVLLGVSSVRFARECGGNKRVLLAAACIVSFGGYLVAFTGLAKPAAFLCALTALAGAFAIRAVSTGRGMGGLGVTAGVAIALHRSGLLLLPCWLLVMAMVVRVHTRPIRRPLEWLLALCPLLAIALFAPKIIDIARHFDVPRHIATGSRTATWRALDLANLLVLLVPAALPILAGAVTGMPRILRSREAGVLVALVAPWIAIATIVMPQQGIFRDLDVFAPGGVALAMLAAWSVIRMHDGSKASNTWVLTAPALTAAATLALLMCFHLPARGLARIEAYATEAPSRSEPARAIVWDFLALRAFALQDWPLAARATAAEQQLAPHPRVLVMLGIARTYLQDFGGAEAAYRELTSRDPDQALGWVGLAGVAIRSGQHPTADSARARLQPFDPQGRTAAEVRRAIVQYPAFWPLPEDPFAWASAPDSARSAGSE